VRRDEREDRAMALIYVEYITRKPGVALQDFHRVAGKQQAAWDEAFADDELLLNLARTWRIGPLPPYLCIWHQPHADLEQLDRWEQIFESGSVDDIEDPINLVIRIDHAGCYRPLLPPARGRSGPYYTEFFEERDGAGAEAVAELYRERAARHDGLQLHLLARRIGHLGPDPRYLAVWGGASYEALGPIAEELDGDTGPVRMVTAGLYTELGREIL
jgi:hypothetical protein